MALQLVVTNAGRAALVNAGNSGTAAVTIASLGVSASAVAATAGMTALPGEIKRLAAVSGEVVADDTIHMTARDEGGAIYQVRSIGVYLSDGTLFALYGQSAVIVDKAAQAILLMAIDVKFADIAATSLSFGDANFVNPPATETVQGVAELATQAESDAGTDDQRIVTPRKLRTSVMAWVASWFSDVWRASNDGAGSGLDADLLDGQQGSWYSNIVARLGYTPANKAGETFAGRVAVRSGGNGYVELAPSGGGDTGVIEFRGSDGARKGYIYSPSSVSNRLEYGNDTGAGHAFYGGDALFSHSVYFGRNSGDLFYAGIFGNRRSINFAANSYFEFVDGANHYEARIGGTVQFRIQSDGFCYARAGFYTPGRLQAADTVWAGNGSAKLLADGNVEGPLWQGGYLWNHIEARCTAYRDSVDRVIQQDTGANGYRVWSSGHKECRGQISVAANANANVTFPLSFVNAPHVVVSQSVRSNTTDQDNGGILEGSINTGGFTIVNGAGFQTTYYWEARGA